MTRVVAVVTAVFLVAFLVMALAGCVGLPEQKLADGEDGCRTLQTVYGTVSDLRSRADNTPKGMSATNKTRMTCGSATLERDGNVTQPPPPPANPAVGGRAGTPPALP